MPSTHDRGRRHRRESTRTAQRAGQLRDGSTSAARPARIASSPSGISIPAWAIALALIVVTVAAYAPVRNFDFVSFDDAVYVTNNPQVRAGLTWAGVWWAFSTTYAVNWHPLTWISHMLDVEFFGLNAGLHHVTSLVLHVVNTLLVWLVLRRLTGSMFRSALVAALFAVHPLHVESVAWVAERKDVLSMCFALLTCWAYAGYVQRPGWWRYVSALVWFALGLMSKPMLVTVPFLLVLLDVWPLRRIAGSGEHGGAQPSMTWWPILREKIPFVILAVMSSAVTLAAQQRGGAVATLAAMPLGARVANALVAYVAYVWQTIWPTNLAALYPYPTSPPFAAAGAAFVALVGATIVILRGWRRWPYLAVGWLWFLGTLVPVIGVIQVGVQARADRYTYLPLIGLFIAGVWGLADVANRWALSRRAVAAAAVTLVIVCAATTRVQAGYWRDGITLWQRAIAVTTANSRAHTNLGSSLVAAGRNDDAVVEYREAIAIEPSLPQAHNNLGLALVTLGQGDAAIEQYREAVRLMPDYVEAHDNLANALMDRHQVDEAIAQYREAIRRRPGDAQTHNNLGTAFAEQGRMADATKEFLEAVRLEPGRADWHYAVGMAYAVQGDNAQAIAYLQSALKLDPGHDRARRALAELGGLPTGRGKTGRGGG